MSFALEIDQDNDAVGSADEEARRSLRLITCLIRPEKLDSVTDALNKLNLVGGMTVTDVRGWGHEKPNYKYYRGVIFSFHYHAKVKVELAVEADDVPEVQKIIFQNAKTGEVGDGRIFIAVMPDIMRIRTQERGVSAL